MKKLCFYIFIALSGEFAFAQDTPAPSASNSLSGFDGMSWGTEYKEAKDRFRTLSSSKEVGEPVSIISDTPETQIKIQRNKLIYRYEFYQKPETLVKFEKSSTAGETTVENKPQEDTNGTNKDKINPRLFLVESTFEYVPAEELYKKLSEKYGQRNGGKIDDKTNRGYYLWNLNGGFLIQWIDPYKKKPFSRSIYYLSKEIVDEIRADFPKFQYTRELNTLMKIIY